MEKTKSKYGEFNTSDTIKAIFAAFILLFITTLVTSFQENGIPTADEMLIILKFSIAGAISTLGAKTLTNSEGKLLKKEPE